MVDQLSAEMSRLVSRGDGSHRITLKLSPEALGDVRVVLTVRGNEMQVRVTGSEAAQRALLAEAGDLHRLLQRIGATSTSIQVGDHSSPSSHHSSQQSGSQSGSQFGNQFGGQPGTAQDGGRLADQSTASFSDNASPRSPHRDGDTSSTAQAGKPMRSTSAMDGFARTGTPPTVSHLDTSRAAGVDVTI